MVFTSVLIRQAMGTGNENKIAKLLIEWPEKKTENYVWMPASTIAKKRGTGKKKTPLENRLSHFILVEGRDKKKRGSNFGNYNKL